MAHRNMPRNDTYANTPKPTFYIHIIVASSQREKDVRHYTYTIIEHCIGIFTQSQDFDHLSFVIHFVMNAILMQY